VDIKDFILIGGGLLIAAVVAHGFWIAWRGRREPLRLDLVPDIVADDVDNIDRLRGELPNGGARVISRETVGEQEMFELEAAPILLEPTTEAQRAEPTVQTAVEPPVAPETVDKADEVDADELLSDDLVEQQPVRAEPSVRVPEARAKVAEVVMAEEPSEKIVSERRAAESPRRPRRPAARKDTDPEQQPVEELVVMNVLARAGEPFPGDALFAVLRGKGLNFGDMNIFHRVDPQTKRVNYSVANVVEPGTFDMADMEAFRSPGLCFFLQLPGPEHPARVFEDMVSVARDVATELGGELKDEQRSFMTPQTVEHYRQRIADFCRRRMSRRA